MRPKLLVFHKENTKNEYITFTKQMEPKLEFETVSSEVVEALQQRKEEILQKIEKLLYDHFLDDTNEDSLASDGEWFPDRTRLTGRYYIGTESYYSSFRGINGHPYDITDGQYRDLWEQDDDGNSCSFLPLSSNNVVPGYQIMIEVRMTSFEKGTEDDYLGVDFTADLLTLDGELDFEILGTDSI